MSTSCRAQSQLQESKRRNKASEKGPKLRVVHTARKEFTNNSEVIGTVIQHEKGTKPPLSSATAFQRVAVEYPFTLRVRLITCGNTAAT